MRLTANLLLETNAVTEVPCILMLHPQSGEEQTIEQNDLKTSVPCWQREYVDNYGNLCLRMMIPKGPFRLEHRIVASCVDTIAVDPEADFVGMEDLPDTVLHYVLPSRYCEADALGDKARQVVGSARPGYRQVEAIRQWIRDNIEYAYGTTDSSSSARDVLMTLKGVCRDYAHVGIALCRGLDIPARMVVGYLYELEPMDLHAWFQAYIGGRWFTFDATQDLPKGNRIVIAYGKDAADVAIATYFNNIELTGMAVSVTGEDKIL